MNTKRHRHTARADAADPRALACVIGLVGALLGLTGLLRRSFDLEAVGRALRNHAAVERDAIVLGAAVILLSAGLAIWTARRDHRRPGRFG